MLVLSRKKNESIVIDERISVMVVEVAGGKVRLGIDAPRDVTVHRQEVFDAIQRNRQHDVVDVAVGMPVDATASSAAAVY
ncbi:MAG: carbon storage regulator CsrA [Thermoguttaceae bacterium]